MASATSTTAPGNPFGNPTPGGSGMMIHPVAAAVPAIVQIDQKKVPVFLGESGKDSLTVREWIRRV